MRGVIVKLDRGFPLVQLEDRSELRCEHATALVKGKRIRAVVGDVVGAEVGFVPVQAASPKTKARASTKANTFFIFSPLFLLYGK